MKPWWPTFVLLVAGFQAGGGSVADAATPNNVWPMYYSPDLNVYAANLRGAGAPEHVVGLLVSDAVNAQFADREAQLEPMMKSAKTLKEEFAPERRQALTELRREKNELLRQALGRLPEQKASRDVPEGVMLRLSEADRDAVRRIMQDYGELIGRIINAAHGYLLDDDREKIRYLESERTVDLGKYFTADEILDFELLETSYGRTARAKLRLMEPTQEELRTYLLIAKKHGYHLAGSDMNSSRVRATWQAVNADLRSTWSPARYAEFRRGISYSYAEIDRLVSRMNLQKAVAKEVFESQRETTEQGYALFTKVHGVVDLTSNTGYGQFTRFVGEQRLQTEAAIKARDSIKALIEQHCAFVRGKLGDEGYRQYQALFDATIVTMQRGGYSLLDYSKD